MTRPYSKIYQQIKLPVQNIAFSWEDTKCKRQSKRKLKITEIFSTEQKLNSTKQLRVWAQVSSLSSVMMNSNGTKKIAQYIHRGEVLHSCFIVFTVFLDTSSQENLGIGTRMMQ